MKKGNPYGKEAWVLVNVGSPDAPDIKSVRKYLREFLGDRFVIDLPYLARKLLVHLVIVPFRAPRSTRKYRSIWTAEGSPLIVNSSRLTEKVRHSAGDRAEVFMTMRYGKPSLKQWIRDYGGRYETVRILPLYPHYSSSTTRTIEELTRKEWKQRQDMSFPFVIKQFWNHPGYLEALTGQIREYDPASFDHVVLTYHGLPERQVNACHPGRTVGSCSCEHEMPADGALCYRATCYATSRRIIGELGLPPDRVTTAFQSRLSKNWLRPFTDEVLEQLAKNGSGRVLVVPVSFVTDNLETLEELDMEYREHFKSSGGEELTLVPALNDRDEWAAAVADIICRDSATGPSGQVEA